MGNTDTFQYGALQKFLMFNILFFSLSDISSTVKDLLVPAAADSAAGALLVPTPEAPEGPAAATSDTEEPEGSSTVFTVVSWADLTESLHQIQQWENHV